MILPKEPSLELLLDLLEIFKWCEEQEKDKTGHGKNALTLKDSKEYGDKLEALARKYSLNVKESLKDHYRGCYCTCWLVSRTKVLAEVERLVRQDMRKDILLGIKLGLQYGS